MRLRDRAWLALLPVLAVPLLGMAVIVLIEHQFIVEARGRLVEHLADERQRLHERFETERKVLTDERLQLRQQLLAQIGASVVDGCDRLRMAAAVLQDDAQIRAVLVDGAATAVLRHRLQGAVHRGNLSEIAVLDSGGLERLRVGGLVLPPTSDRLSDAVPVRNQQTDESVSPWYRAWRSERADNDHCWFAMGDTDLGCRTPVLSLLVTLRDEARQPIGLLRLAAPIDHLFGRRYQQVAAFVGTLELTDATGQLWRFDQRRRWRPVSDGDESSIDERWRRELLGGVLSLSAAIDLPATAVAESVDPLPGGSQAVIAEIEATPSALVWSVMGLALAGLVGFALLLRWFESRWWRSARQMTGAAEQIASGDLSEPIPISGDGEWQRATKAVEGLRASLVDRIRTLESGNRELQQASRLKSSFLANMSHEIRTPMSGVIGMTELLATTSLDHEQRDLTGTLHRSAESVLHIIEDVLDLSRIESGEMTLAAESFNLRWVMEECARMVAERAQAKGLDVYVQLDTSLRYEFLGDPARIQQIVLNLLTNAVKYTDMGHVQLQVTVLGESSGQCDLRIAVVDTGVGLAAEEHERIFDPYVRGEFAGGSGSGLGLTISRQLARLMGSDIVVDTGARRGTTFHFDLRLPVSIALAWPERRDDRPVLLVTDDDRLSAHCQSILVPGGYRFERARTLDSAEALIAASVEGGGEDAYSTVFWDKRVFGDDPACTFERDDNPSRVPYQVLIVPMIARATLPELVIACFDRVVTTPLRTALLLECIERDAVRVQDSISSTSLANEAASGERSLAGKVLLVEDNQVNRTVARRILEHFQLDVVEAHDGLEALAALDRESFDLVLMDCEMPNLDGYHTTEEIRMGEEGSDYHLPILALTAKATDLDRRRCLSVGMDAFLAKPVKSETLYLVLRQFLRPGLHRQRR